MQSYTIINKETPKVNLDFKTWDWLLYDTDNLYPQRVVDFLASPIHNSICNTKRAYALGNGIGYDQNDRQLVDFFERNDINDLLDKSFYDMILFGGFSWFVKWSLDLSKVVAIEHVNYSKVRIQFPDVNGCFDGYYLSADWKKFLQYGRYKPVFVDKFNENSRDTSKCYLYSFSSYNPTINYYAYPDYHAIIKWLMIDLEVANFHNNNVRNGFVPSAFLTMPDIGSKEQQNEFVDDLKNTYAGTSNSGNIMVAFGTSNSAGDSEKPVFTPISTSNNADIYANLQNEIKTQIISGHGLNSPTLAGLVGQGGLGGNASEIKTAVEIFQNMIIPKYRDPVMNQLRNILKINGFDTEIIIKNTMPIRSVFSEGVMQSIMTTNELRKEMGLDPIEKGDSLNGAGAGF